VKRYLLLVGDIALLLGTLLAVAILHNNVLVPDTGAYGTFLNNNVPIWLTSLFLITSVAVAIIFRIKKLILKDRYVGIAHMCNFSRLGAPDLLLAGIVGLCCGLFFVCFSALPAVSKALPDLQNYVSNFNTADNFLLVILGLCIVGPLFEETFFRGIIFNTLRRTLPLGVALVVQALIYAAIQPNHTIALLAFFLALVFGLLYYRLKSLWSTIVANAVMNAVIFGAAQFDLYSRLATLGDSILWLSSGTCIFFIVAAIVFAWTDRQVAYVKMVGDLALWIGIYAAIYYPTEIFWNNTLNNIPAFQRFSYYNYLLYFPMIDFPLIGLFYLAMKRIHKRNLFAVCNFSAVPLKSAGYIVVLGIAMGVWVQCFFTIPSIATNYPQFQQLFEYLTDNLLPAFLLFLVVHSAFKEMFFRALIYNVLRAATPISVSILVTGVIYGGLFFNWDIPLTIYASVGALIFSLMFEWYKSIIAPIINEVMVFGTYYVLKQFTFGFNGYVLVGLLASSATVVGMMILLWKGRDAGTTSVAVVLPRADLVPRTVAAEQIAVSAASLDTLG
jgi:membrane protease YdiL (CAAX protease family)